MRVKTGFSRRRKHNKLLGKTKGYSMLNHKRVRMAHQAVLHAGEYAFAGRKLRKRDFRSLWIQRISAALQNMGLSYSKFIGGLKAKNITLNRKMLAELVVRNPEVFNKLVEQVKA